MAFLLERTFKYRVDSEEEAKEFIEEQEQKANDNGYVVKTSKKTLKQKKKKGEIEDEGYEVVITTTHGTFWEV